MNFPDRRTASVLLTTLLFAVVLAILYVARSVVVIFAFAILFAYLIRSCDFCSDIRYFLKTCGALTCWRPISL